MSLYQNFALDDQHFPVILLTKSDNANCNHLVNITDSTIYGAGSDRFIKIKNSVAESEIGIKLDMTPNSQGWKLSSPDCIYIKLN